MTASTHLEIPIGLDDITSAAAILSGEADFTPGRRTPVAIRTPLVYSESLSRQVSCNVWLKLENLQKTGSYKVRGAFNNIARLPESERAKGVVTASAGNHAQGVALAASIFGIEGRTSVFVPVGTPKVKQDNTRGFGVEVIETGENFDQARARAYEESDISGRTFIEPFDDWNTIAGQGTVGLEIIEDLPKVAGILAPVGGGGLIAGITLATKRADSGPRVIGVEAEGAASMIEALSSSEVVALSHPAITQIADGIKVREVGHRPFAVCRKHLGLRRFMTVPDIETVAAIADLMVYAKVIAEGAGAITMAALRSIQTGGVKKIAPFAPDDHVVVVISGGNIDPSFSWRILYEQTVPNLLTIRLAMPDRPGELLRMLMPIYQAKVNIIDVDVNRLDARPRMGERIVEVCVAVSTQSQADSLVESLDQAGYNVLVSRWEDPKLERGASMVKSQVLPGHASQDGATVLQQSQIPDISPIVIKRFGLTDRNGRQRRNNIFAPGEEIFVEAQLRNSGPVPVPKGVVSHVFADQRQIVSNDSIVPTLIIQHGQFPAKSGIFGYSSRPNGSRESRFKGSTRSITQSKPGTYVARLFVDVEGRTGGSTESHQAAVEYLVSDEAIPAKDVQPAGGCSPPLIVNKKYRLPDDYVPSELQELASVAGGQGHYLVPTAAIAFEELNAKATQDGIGIRVLSGYRSFADQQRTHVEYIADLGLERAEEVSARPGHSEHQTGLAVDLGDSHQRNHNFRVKFRETPAGKWLADHAHEYGFILRYPEGKSDITGFAYEPWHFRYVGKELATEIHEFGITLEEFTQTEGGDYRRGFSKPDSEETSR